MGNDNYEFARVVAEAYSRMSGEDKEEFLKGLSRLKAHRYLEMDRIKSAPILERSSGVPCSSN